MQIVLIILIIIGIASVLCSYIDLQKHIKKYEDKEIDTYFLNIAKQKISIEMEEK